MKNTEPGAPRPEIAGSTPRVLLIQPPVYDFALYDLFHQPYGLLRLGRWFEESGYQVDLLDSLDPAAPGRRGPGRGKFLRQVVRKPELLQGVNRDFARYGVPEAEIKERIRRASPDLVLVTTGMTYWYPGIAETGRLVREVCPDVPIVAGGTYATLLPEHCSEQLGTNLVVRGQAGDSIGPILARLGLPPLSGPLPYLPSVGLRAGSARLRSAAAIRLHDGCPNRCAYCASSILSPRFSCGDPAALVDHMELLHRRYGISTFAFYDDALLHRAGIGVVPLLDGVLDRFGPGILEFYLPNAVHLDSIDDDLARLMYMAGFREIRFGLESTDAGFHRTLDTKVRLGHLSDAIESLKRAGFAGGQITAYILLGLPGQEFTSVQQTLDDSNQLGINVSLSEYSPVPRTPLYFPASESSPLDLDAEPLFHNNSVFPLLSGNISATHMREARAAVRAIRRGVVNAAP